MPGQHRLDFWGILDRRKWVVFLGLITGIGLSVLYYYQTPVLYKSTAKIRIFPRDPIMANLRSWNSNGILPHSEEIMPTRHDKIIREEVTIRRCLEGEQQDGALYKLPSFKGQEADLVVKEVYDNMTVTPDKEDIYNYEIEYVSTDMDDSKTIVNSIVNTYRKSLESYFKSETAGSLSHLQQISMNTDEKLMEINKKILELNLQDKAPRVNTQFDTDIYSVSLQSLQPKIDRLQDQLKELTEQRRNCLDALELGTEAQLAQVQVLLQQRKVDLKNENSTQEFIANDRMMQIIMELETERQSQRQQYGTGHPEIKKLDSRIAGAKQLLEEQRKFSKEVNKKEFTDPGLVLQYYVQGLDQQIDAVQFMLQKSVVDFNNAMREASRLLAIRRQREALEAERIQIERRREEVMTQIMEISPNGRINT